MGLRVSLCGKRVLLPVFLKHQQNLSSDSTPSYIAVALLASISKDGHVLTEMTTAIATNTALALCQKPEPKTNERPSGRSFVLGFIVFE